MSKAKRSANQRSSDPLPYVQVDRAVLPKATSLAELLKVTRQHAVGSLVAFWELCGEPRELERLVQSGKHEVVLPREVVARRFKLASGGHAVEIDDLEALGLVEEREGGLRIRGMSRYFEPIRKRLHNRTIAAAGGKVRGAAERDVHGRFAGAGGPAGAPAGGGAGDRAGSGLAGTSPHPSPVPAQNQPTGQPTPQPGASTADSGQRTASGKRNGPAEPAGGALRAELEAAFLAATGRAYLFSSTKDGAALKALLAAEAPEEIMRRWRLGLKAEGWHHTPTVAQLRQKWNDLAKGPPAPKGALPTANGDWSDRAKSFKEELGDGL